MPFSGNHSYRKTGTCVRHSDATAVRPDICPTRRTDLRTRASITRMQLTNKGEQPMRLVKCKKLLRRSAGFTLIDMMMVVGIIGIVAPIAFPSYQTYDNRPKRSATP